VSVDIIIPTFNNLPYLLPCLNSIFQHTLYDSFRVIVVNNGTPEHMEELNNPNIKVLQQTQNLGWEGGLVEGMKESQSDFLIFMNDDTMVPPHQRDWLTKLLKHFEDPNVGAVGPSSNVVMGRQNIFLNIKEYLLNSKFLIGFCMAVRRSAIDAAGGIDESLPGGDDLDLSIRLRNLGNKLLIARDIFIYHHGFKTGERLEGKPNQTNGWNSIEKIEQTNFALINKHDLFKFLDLWSFHGL